MGKSDVNFVIIAIPRFSLACKNFLKEKNLLSHISLIREIPISLVPIDSDVLSMEDSCIFAVFRFF